MKTIFLPDVGTIFETEFEENGTTVSISDATSKEMFFRRPDGTAFTKTAVFTTNGNDGKIRYTSIANDIDQEGYWQRQGKVVRPSGTFHTIPTGFLARTVLV